MPTLCACSGDASTPADGGLSGEELARRVQHDVIGRYRDMLLLIITGILITRPAA